MEIQQLKFLRHCFFIYAYTKYDIWSYLTSFWWLFFAILHFSVSAVRFNVKTFYWESEFESSLKISSVISPSVTMISQKSFLIEIEIEIETGDSDNTRDQYRFSMFMQKSYLRFRKFFDIECSLFQKYYNEFQWVLTKYSQRILINQGICNNF